jgi:hypothetical protein
MRAFVILCCVLVTAAAQGDDSKRETSKAEAANSDVSTAHGGDSERDQGKSEMTTPDVSAAPLAYIPPASIGAPRDRMIGAATRSARLPGPTLYSLVPEHTGKTVSTQPSLFWYLDTLPSEDTPVYFTLTNEQQIDPIVEIQLSKVSEVGIQRVDLALHGIELERGTEYEWTVAVVVDPEQRANDVVTAGWVMVVNEPAGLEPSARSYAVHGLWYDAIAAASDDFRADLLREVGLGSLVHESAPN